MRYIIVFALFGLFLGCKSSKDLATDEPFMIEYDETLLDTLTVSATKTVGGVSNKLPIYRESYKRVNDLTHTKLEVSFDWAKEEVIGQAELSFQAIRPNQLLELHAQNFILNDVSLNGRKLNNFSYDDQVIKIPLDKTYKRGDTFKVSIDYVARPSIGPKSGSSAIASDQGLFFINSDNSVANKPQQIWTQGETEHNSRWFPTIDKPNERTSQEIYLTVEDRFKTLSNGKLVSSVKNSDGTRTDYWRQELPHAPYLFMVAVGEFSITEEQWRNKPLMYYVEPAYKSSAKEIFNHTPEMLTFFSELLGYEYPWDKYAQVIARDYVSGAMENTGAVIFGEFVQKNEIELIDNDNDLIVAHEMIHHWFGDLVTCESWSNLTMNEGFANYGEYLWFEHKYGKDHAEAHRINELGGYLYSASQSGTHDLIHYGYDDKEDMFDAHSYNKGGLVLHMLRDYLGDETFFLGLNQYLHVHEFTAVEADDLRLIMEDVSGEDLNWFFNQWYFDQGHPVLDVNYEYEPADLQVTIDVQQTQDPISNRAIFQIPFTAKLYFDNGLIKEQFLFLDEREQSFVIDDIRQKPNAIVLDGNHIMLGEINESRSPSEWVFLFNNTDTYEDRISAVNQLKDKPEFNQIYEKALSDDYHSIRNVAIAISTDSERLKSLAQNDQHVRNRSRALSRLYEIDQKTAINLSKQIVNKEIAYPVITRALSIMGDEDLDQAIELALEKSKDYERPYLGVLFQLMERSANPEYLSFFEKYMDQIDVYSANYFFDKYDKIAQNALPGRMIESSKLLQNVSMDGSVPSFKRYLSTRSISGLIRNLKARMAESGDTQKQGELEKAIENLNNTLNQIIEAEQDVNLRAKYESFISE